MLKTKLEQCLDSTDEKMVWLILALTLIGLLVFGGFAVVEGKPLPQKNEAAAKRPVRKASLRPAPKKTVSSLEAPAFSLKNLAGKEIALSDYQGQIIVLNFWATWCGPCQIETPWLVELRQKYQARGVEVIGVSVDALEPDYDVQDIRAFIKEHQVRYPIALATNQVVEAYGPIIGIPATIVIDRAGKIHARHRGLITFEKLENEIKGLL